MQPMKKLTTHFPPSYSTVCPTLGHKTRHHQTPSSYAHPFSFAHHHLAPTTRYSCFCIERIPTALGAPRRQHHHHFQGLLDTHATASRGLLDSKRSLRRCHPDGLSTANNAAAPKGSSTPAPPLH
ncbi:hypothetical protein BDA96_02G187600 [Sorghum bicolor]|uniref:Uncharacterized protein n=2 Tax=Sorghum bicolor TaxID=4558 RepID=A0A921UU72_SORBI|nr:hypothetical protein BDA96_02G187600 [Sorghum bicolor]KXG35467.1 hypothetical protein SORBI_3002G178200 [Sorghum bicolor]